MNSPNAGNQISLIYEDSLLCWFFLLVGWLAERKFGKKSKRNKDKGNFGLRFYFVDSPYFLEGRYSPKPVKVFFFDILGVENLNVKSPFWLQDFGLFFADATRTPPV